MGVVNELIKEHMLPLGVNMGIEKMFSISAKNNLMILVYHGVTTNPNKQINNRHLNVIEFEQHLKYYKDNFDIVSQNELIAMYRNGINPNKKTIALTFDDCYLNNYEVVYPILKKYNLPATFYAVTKSYTETDFMFYFDMFDIWGNATGYKNFVFDNIEFEYKNRQYYSAELNDSFYNYAIGLSDTIIDKLEKFKVDYKFGDVLQKSRTDYWKQINKEQLIELANTNLIEIGSHTHSHYYLSKTNAQLAKTELETSKKILEELIQKEIVSIAYPYGSYTEEVKKLTLEANYKNLLAVTYQCESDNNDKTILPRLCISNTTSFEVNMILLHKGFNQLAV